MIQQGHIVRMPFPYSDLSAKKVRPALIVSNNILNGSSDVIAVGISKTPGRHHTVEIDLQDFERGTLMVKSYIHCHKIHQVEKGMFQEIVAKVKPEVLQKVIREINKYLT
jgi:mRNA interferase MazF